MPFIKLKNAVEHARFVASIVGENDKMRVAHAAASVSAGHHQYVDETYWRTYDYCAAVVRLYAGLERYIFDVVEDWIKFLSQHDPQRLFSSSAAMDRYKHGASEIFRRSSEARFSRVDLGALAESLMHFFQGRALGRVISAGFFAALPNLRLTDLEALLKAVQLEACNPWISKFPPLLELCDAANITVESQLKDLVERRNEAAHGNELPVDTLGTQLLKDLAEFVAGLSTAICELVADSMSSYALDGRRETAKIGDVENVYRGPQACNLKSCGNPIWVGMRMLVKSNNRCFVTEVTDIQLEELPYSAITPNPGDLIGLKFTVLPKKGVELYRLDLLPLLANVGI